MTAHERDDELEALWLEAGHGVEAEATFLRELSRQRVMAILRQPPGPDLAAPQLNLVQWQRKTDGATFIPVFTRAAHIAFECPLLQRACTSPCACCWLPEAINVTSSTRYQRRR